MSAIPRVLLAAAAAATIAACAPPDSPDATAELVSVPVYDLAANTTHLSGDQERPNPVDTRAVGQFVMKLSKDGSSIEYRLVATNIENVTMAHLHRITTPGATTGGVVVWLYPNVPPLAPMLIAGRSSGILTEGTITAANLTGSLAGQPLSALMAAIASGSVYVNVHTRQHPPGEIRGDMH